MSSPWITGAGVMSAAGAGLDGIAGDLAAARIRAVGVDRSAGLHRSAGACTAVLASHLPTAEWIPPMVARRMSPGSRLAVVAARTAAADAALGPERVDGAAVVLATIYGAATVTEKLLRQIMLESPEAASPALFTESVANAPAAQVALQLGARGPNITVTQRQAGALLALGRAAALIRAGHAEVVLAGAVDEVSPLLHAALDRFGALTTPGPSGGETPRPFDRRRDGCLAGEGAAVLVVESESHARRRGARPLAILAGAGRSFDPSSPRSGWPRDPRPLAEDLEAFLRRHGGRPDVAVTGGSGARGGDRLEGLVLARVLDPLPPLLAPKAVLGDHGSAQLTTAMVTLAGGHVAPPPGFGEVDPGIGVAPFSGGVLSPSGRTLITAFAPGGAASWALLDRP